MALDTDFAPAARDRYEDVIRSTETVVFSGLTQHLLDSIPDFAVILNDKRQIVAANKALMNALELKVVQPMLGLRLGELLGCSRVSRAPSGCGTSAACATCGALASMMQSFETRDGAERECRVRAQLSNGPKVFDFLAKSSYLQIEGEAFVVVVLRDIGAEKRRHVLERVFFHDVLKEAETIQSISRLIAPVEDPWNAAIQAADIRRLSHSVVESITAQRDLVDAEEGVLKTKIAHVRSSSLILEVLAHARGLKAAQKIAIDPSRIDEFEMRTDKKLLRRVITLMLKNAIEATEEGGVVTFEAQALPTLASFRVRNEGVLPKSVQDQMFQRSFTTKSEKGRGLGGYMIQSITEKYLNGHVWFVSSKQQGTTFVVEIPYEPDALEKAS